MPVRKLSILGSTGSIGTQALSLTENLGIAIESLSAYGNVGLLEEQALRFHPRFVCAVDEKAAADLKISLAHTSTKVFGGAQSLTSLMEMDESDTVLTSVVGIAGLQPTLAAIRANKTIALANKETMVAGGQLVRRYAAENNVAILPVDSEHSAIFQCLQDGNSRPSLRRIFLTASGGPFFGLKREELSDITPERALQHPNWVMGAKVTIDSASLMNKGLELMEAMWLFSLAPRDIVITVHRQSIVHSMVEFSDHSVLAQLGVPDMRLPIQYALTWPYRQDSPVQPLNIEQLSHLTFEKPDPDTFVCLSACTKAAEMGGLAPCAANAANEIAVHLFLTKKIRFLQIGEAVMTAVQNCRSADRYTLEELLETDRMVREETKSRYS